MFSLKGRFLKKKCLVLRSRVFQIFVPWPWRSKCFKVLIIAVVFLLCSENVEKQWAPSFIYSFFLMFFSSKRRTCLLFRQIHFCVLWGISLRRIFCWWGSSNDGSEAVGSCRHSFWLQFWRSLQQFFWAKRLCVSCTIHLSFFVESFKKLC